jgi:DNA gyrase subunit A
MAAVKDEVINLKGIPKIGPAVPGVAEDDRLIVTLSGKVIRIQTKQVRASGRATQGVRLINLENGDKICSWPRPKRAEHLP